MRIKRCGKKKLIVAFHFQFSNHAAWKCDNCRKSGLEQRRRCGWLYGVDVTAQDIVWARRQIATTSCPTSYVTPESLALLEEFHVWKLIGSSDMHKLPARMVDAIFILENELRAENRNGSN